ncbi:TetR/AcrR family fatty acid metabolism transcriptional regulator [Desulfosalsimonas propionicica]|jgi:TetR/AcrR family fatty acid metabolism transcriptional regulator|uniref:TetR/AcrR family fatty acid metabolism transcriptional regulator n=1 Tax=Desulfosalsimonas propionicica TaxID=332175 RepID=A0A7W0CCI2_9BACT|nr:TetR/AcrR family transcriptional regulator [Desulfosalsimonas propionicica]MBA2883244.1 TetR/AcrR family fatty acid metabolism transcriptional regulator [Desulfosalsimonas propionicica]
MDREQARTGAINSKYHLILDAAIKVFAEQGFHQATISQVAREAGVADGTIYLYFKNKADILSNFFSYRSRQVFDRFRQVVDQADSAEEKLRNLIRLHLSEFQRDRNMAVVFQREALLARYVKDEYIIEVTRMYMDILTEIIRLGQAEGTIRKQLPLGLAKRFILGAVNEVINTWVVTGGEKDMVKMADPLVDFYFDGIGTRSNPEMP